MAQSSIEPLALSEGVASPSTAPLAREPVDVNTATADHLRKCVPKVGAVLAQRIIDFREENGPFKSIDELMTVPGIGRRLAESLFPPAAGESMVVALHQTTLPPPWGTPNLPTNLDPSNEIDKAAADAPNEAPVMHAMTEMDQTNQKAEDASKEASAETQTDPRPSRAPRVRAHAFKLVALAFAIVVGLCAGVYANTQSVKRPTRELNERIDVTRAENDRTRTDLDQQRTELRDTEDAVKALSAKVEAESAERKSDQARVSHDVATLHDTVKKTNQSNEARIQRLRETLTEIELYHGANIAHPAR